jgi:hypothetical protein
VPALGALLNLKQLTLNLNPIREFAEIDKINLPNLINF